MVRVFVGVGGVVECESWRHILLAMDGGGTVPDMHESSRIKTCTQMPSWGVDKQSTSVYPPP